MLKKINQIEDLNVPTFKNLLLKQDLIKDITAPMEVEKFTTGFSNLTYLIKVENNEYVLRRPPKGAIKRGHDMGREYKVLSGLNKGFKKAPKVYLYSEDLNIFGAPFYLMEKVKGNVLNYPMAVQSNIEASTFQGIAKTWLDTFVELHQLDYKSIGLADLGKPDGYVERQVRNWSKQYLKAQTEEIPYADKVMQWLHDKQPTKYDHSLIHNDYKYDNVVFKENDWEEIVAVLDWEMCTLGDPLMDLGASLAYWITEDDNPMISLIFKTPTTLKGNPSRMEIVNAYSKLTGKDIPNLTFYYAFGLFKNAVIVQQIYYRYANGYTNNEKFAQLNKATQLFLGLSWQAIQTGKI
ncbi:MAG: phosphotransferase family protein [Bacteroidota bacterium]